MAKLFIIGNGFDLYHGMPTRYSDYHDFLDKHDKKVSNWFDNLRIDFNDNHCNWNDIEGCSDLNCEDHFGEIVSQYYPNISDEDFHDRNWNDIDVVSEVEFSNGIKFYKTLFEEWLKSIPMANNQNPLISSIISKDDYFISFNYTRTLEELYGIPSNHVFHIHGMIGDKWLQFGSINNRPEDIKKILEDRYGQDDFYGASVEYGVNNAMNLYKAAFKDINMNLIRLNSFLKWITGYDHIDEIGIFGHAVKYEFMDKPYYERILIPRFKNINWIFYYYRKSNDLNDQLEFIDEMHLPYFQQIQE